MGGQGRTPAAGVEAASAAVGPGLHGTPYAAPACVAVEPEAHAAATIAVAPCMILVPKGCHLYILLHYLIYQSYVDQN